MSEAEHSEDYAEGDDLEPAEGEDAAPSAVSDVPEGAREADARESTADLWADDEEAEAPLGEDSEDKPGLERAPLFAEGPERLMSVLESLIFVSSRPITERQLAKLTHADPRELRPLLHRLAEHYEGRGITLQPVAGGWQFRSATANAPFVRVLVAPKPVRLSRAQTEALAIVAYRQPITRPEIDEIRGVDSGPALKALAERNLLRIGRKEEPGRPLLYGTGEHFLEFFGLGSLKDLPTLQEFSELSEDSRALFERRMGEPLDLRAVEAQARAAEEAAQSAMLEQADAQLGLDELDDVDDVDEVVEDAPRAPERGEAPEPDEAEPHEDDAPEEAEERSEMSDEPFDELLSDAPGEVPAAPVDLSDDFDDGDFVAGPSGGDEYDDEDDELDEDDDDDLDDDEDEDEDDDLDDDDEDDDDDDLDDEDEDDDEDDDDLDDDEDDE